jgi:NADH-quinone oxidoreductase subunit H
MALGWKVLIPISLLWILLVSTIRVLRNEDLINTNTILVVAAGLLVAVGVIALIGNATQRRKPAEELAAEPEPEAFDPMAGGYPVPPLPGQTLPTGTAAARTLPSQQEDVGV